MDLTKLRDIAERAHEQWVRDKRREVFTRSAGDYRDVFAHAFTPEVALQLLQKVSNLQNELAEVTHELTEYSSGLAAATAKLSAAHNAIGAERLRAKEGDLPAAIGALKSELGVCELRRKGHFEGMAAETQRANAAEKAVQERDEQIAKLQLLLEGGFG